MPEISIIMPVYNGEAFLNEAIDSVINQTFSDWEFIIINEFGSNEKATTILRDYEKKDSRIKIVQNTERLRISASMNVGIDNAKGKYIARMDADDICAPNRLAIQHEYMEQHTDIDICGIKPTLFGEANWEWKVETDSETLKSDTLFFTPFVHPTIMIRKESLEKQHLRYDKNFHYTEDYEFFERAAYSLKYANITDQSLYRYRMHSKNATNVGGDEGVKNYLSVQKRAFERLGLHFSEEDISMLCVHTYKKEDSVDNALDSLVILDILLKKIWWNKDAREQFGIYPLFRTLHKRWMRAWECYRYNSEFVSDGRVQAAIERGLFAHTDFYKFSNENDKYESPLVSVVIPTYNSEKYVQDTIYSILLQTFQNFEILLVNEFGSDDKTVELVSQFSDSRIHIIQNKTKLGLADSLNEGIKLARGTYIARADADDVYPDTRFEKQVKFLESNPEISLCGTWQRHFGKRNYIHAPVKTPEEIKAMTIFKCDICHSTIMFRKKDFVDNNFFYDKSFAAEDFELWSRAVGKLKFYNIPEILGEYRWDGDNITASKMEILLEQEQKIVARTLKKLEITIKDSDLILLSGWKNPFQDYSRSDRKELLKKRRSFALSYRRKK
ncbi:glycosyltransferase family 2 protein [Treponema zioleckii]|uniref:glycosyltransferase family 2 protein n=1 Tax=Treponema zioleckii TaxID=331680 RepID=UPI00168B1912|nr:glycosyltransferase [Treponema zioleckii]